MRRKPEKESANLANIVKKPDASKKTSKKTNAD
jgi:hypothetical protein